MTKSKHGIIRFAAETKTFRERGNVKAPEVLPEEFLDKSNSQPQTRQMTSADFPVQNAVEGDE